MNRLLCIAVLTFVSALTNASAQTVPNYIGTPGSYIAHNFHFGSGETLPDLKLHYLTL